MSFSQLNEEVIKVGLCHYCGTCAGVCPERCIEMDHETEEPQLVRECPPDCDFCHEVCPGKNVPMLDFDRMVFGRERGVDELLLGIGQDFIECHAADPMIRERGGGGGVVSALLTYALEKDIIDAALVVTMSQERPWVAVPAIATNQEEVIAAAQAKETLVPVNSLLGEAIAMGFKRLGVVCLPCHVHGIRKAQLLGKPRWAVDNIKLLIGMFCGMNYSRRGTEHMIGDWAELPLEQVAKLDYRGGPYPGMFTVTAKDGEVISIPSRACRNTYLAHAHDRCMVCYDYANEEADISIGDYFGIEMKRGMPGESTAIIRTEPGRKLFESAESDGCVIAEPVAEEDFYRGGFEHKKHGSAFRIYERRRYGLPVPDCHLPLDFEPLPRKLNLAHPLIS